MRVVFGGAILIALLTGAAVSEAQTADAYATYRTAVATYATSGDIARAVAPIQRWSRAEFDTAVKATIAAGNAADIETAATFHLEIGVALVGVALPAANSHVMYGEALLDRLARLEPRFKTTPQDAANFRAMWYGVAGSAFIAIKELSRARQLVSRAVESSPRSARAMTLQGALREFEASQINPDDWVNLNQRERLQRERAVRLFQASEAYRQALKYDDGYAMAHIRLGRVLHLLDHPNQARAPLERGRALAKDPLSAYLAALFLGALQQDAKDVASARRSFEQALAIAPASQPAVVALAHLELMDGRPDRANAVARSLAEAPPTRDPWWAFHNGALDTPGLRWLRERAMR